ALQRRVPTGRVAGREGVDRPDDLADLGAERLGDDTGAQVWIRAGQGRVDVASGVVQARQRGPLLRVVVGGRAERVVDVQSDLRPPGRQERLADVGPVRLADLIRERDGIRVDSVDRGLKLVLALVHDRL